MKEEMEKVFIALTLTAVLLALFITNINYDVKTEHNEYEKECAMQRYTVRGLPEMLIVCDDGGWFDTSSYNPDREEMIITLTEEL